MATSTYDSGSLRKFSEDLQEISANANNLADLMDEKQIKTIVINNSVGQIAGRLAMHRFISDGHLALKILLANEERGVAS